MEVRLSHKIRILDYNLNMIMEKQNTRIGNKDVNSGLVVGS